VTFVFLRTFEGIPYLKPEYDEQLFINSQRENSVNYGTLEIIP
jgi:hypothetical protein